MNRAWHQKKAREARRWLKHDTTALVLQYWRGRYDAHIDAMTAIDRSAKRVRAAKRKKAA
jgi:hypothetical protein